MRWVEQQFKQIGLRLRRNSSAARLSGRSGLFLLIATCGPGFNAHAFAQNSKSKTPSQMHLELEKSTDLPRIYEKTYTKEDLQKTMPPNPALDLNARISKEMLSLLQQIAEQQSGDKQIRAVDGLKTINPDDTNYFVTIAALKDAPKARALNTDELRAYLARESQKAGTERIKSRSQLLQNLGSGLNFNLDIDSLLQDKSTETASSGPRYGLILQDIEPATKGMDRAAVADMRDELQFAGHANVKWTIGPLEEDHQRRIWQSSESATSTDSRVRIPKASFSGRVLPENLENLSSLGSKDGPGWNLELYQTEQFYKLNYRTNSSGTKLSEEHTLKVPVTGTLAVGQRYNDKFQVIQTSAYDVLMDPNLPLLSFHVLPIEGRYASDVGYKFGLTNISATARGKAQGKVERAADIPEQYTLNLSRSL